MSAIATTTARQFFTLAPRVVTFRGRKYTRNENWLVDGDVARFDFVARKRRGAFLSDKVAIRVELVGDTYSVQIDHFDGLTLDSDSVRAFDGVHWDSFEDVGAVWLR